jgi:hypothetical protein
MQLGLLPIVKTAQPFWSACLFINDNKEWRKADYL